jgi:hypothetical protein
MKKKKKKKVYPVGGVLFWWVYVRPVDRYRRQKKY